MAIPDKKIYRNGKLMFDPNNPEDVKNYREKQPLMEAFNLVRGLTDPRGGGGLVGMARKAASKLVSKVVAKETVKKVTRKSNKKATPTVKEVVEKPVEIVKETLSRLLKPIPKLNKSKSFTTAKAKNALDEIPKDKPAVKTKPTKSDEVIPKINRKESYSPVKPNSIGTSQTSKIIPEVIPTTIPKATEFAGRPTFGPYSSRTNLLSEVIYGQKDVYKNLRAKAAEKAKEVPEIPKEKLDNFSKLVLGTAGLGIAGGISYQGYKGYQGLTSKPIDLNNINENDLSDSTKYKDVKKDDFGRHIFLKTAHTGNYDVLFIMQDIGVVQPCIGHLQKIINTKKLNSITCISFNFKSDSSPKQWRYFFSGSC